MNLNQAIKTIKENIPPEDTELTICFNPVDGWIEARLKQIGAIDNMAEFSCEGYIGDVIIGIAEKLEGLE